MHSNLSSVDEVIATSRLPDAVRPATLAFGTLADGFLPFDVPQGGENHVNGAGLFRCKHTPSGLLCMPAAG